MVVLAQLDSSANYLNSAAKRNVCHVTPTRKWRVHSDEMADLIAHFAMRGGSVSPLSARHSHSLPSSDAGAPQVLWCTNSRHQTWVKWAHRRVKSSASTREIGLAQPGETCWASELLEHHSPFFWVSSKVWFPIWKFGLTACCALLRTLLWIQSCGETSWFFS